MRQHLEGRGGGTLAQAAAGDGAQATPRPHGSPALPDVAQSREKPPGQPPEARAGQSGSPLRPAPGIPSQPATSVNNPLSPKPTCPSRPYPLGAPAELVLCVPQSHRILVDIVRHTHHLEYGTPRFRREPWAPHSAFSVLSLAPRPASLWPRTAPSHKTGQAPMLPAAASLAVAHVPVGSHTHARAQASESAGVQDTLAGHLAQLLVHAETVHHDGAIQDFQQGVLGEGLLRLLGRPPQQQALVPVAALD